jgi:hypothetical protein
VSSKLAECEVTGCKNGIIEKNELLEELEVSIKTLRIEDIGNQ